MTDYATVADVQAVLARDVLDTDATDGTAASLSGPTLQAQLDAAQAEVDARLAGRYTVPFDPVPALVKSLTVDVAAYLANLVFRQSKDLTDDDPMVRRYQRALTILTQLGSGAMDLPGAGQPDSDAPVSAGRPSVRNPYTGRMFDLDGFGLGYGTARRRIDLDRLS